MLQHKLLVGVDVGCRKHTVAISGPGGISEQFEIAHDASGFQYFFSQVAKQARLQKTSNVYVGMEGTNGYARPLDQKVKAQGYYLLNVNNLKLARFKEIFAAPAKTDCLDAQQIVTLMMMAPFMERAKEILQEVPTVDKTEVQLKRISRRRRQLVQEKVVIQNRMQADLQSVCPGFLDTIKQVDCLYVLRFLSLRSDFRKLARVKANTLRKIPGIGKALAAKLTQWQQTASFGEEIEWVGPMISEDAKRILELKQQINALKAQLENLISQSSLASLLKSIPGFGIVCAAEISGEVGTLDRFKSESGLALYLGVAPLDNSSGTYKGTKSPRQVNKRCRAAMLAAMAHHIRKVEESRTYYDKKRAEGKKHNQALRSLGRHLTRVIWSMVKNNRKYLMQQETTDKAA
jgi:transposase